MKWISCTKCTILYMRLMKHVLLWPLENLKIFLVLLSLPKTLCWNSSLEMTLNIVFLDLSENQHHQLIVTGHSIGLKYFLPLILFFCLSLLSLVLSCTPLPVDSLSFSEHSCKDKFSYLCIRCRCPYTCVKLPCQVLPLSPSTPLSNFWRENTSNGVSFLGLILTSFYISYGYFDFFFPVCFSEKWARPKPLQS